ncbi:hypothetical protein DAI22_07g204200 [Oryza sativa Japonica Group]|nr:hypothetical protein DAI22_07g204200 [Oryza sativa Japonica Group]KAF2923591.1 hypothetical protein DAI22_07g204200 [Oryza sativa Japonica Group]
MAMAAPARDDEEPQDGYYSIVYELHAPGDDEWLLRHLWREAHPMAQAGGEAGAPVLGRMMAAMRRWWWRADPQLHLGRARLLLRRWRAGSASARRLARWRREGGVTPRVLLQSAEVVAARPSTGRAQGLDGLGGRHHGLDVPHPQGHRRLLRLPQHPLPICAAIFLPPLRAGDARLRCGGRDHRTHPVHLGRPRRHHGTPVTDGLQLDGRPVVPEPEQQVHQPDPDEPEHVYRVVLHGEEFTFLTNIPRAKFYLLIAAVFVVVFLFHPFSAET